MSDSRFRRRLSSATASMWPSATGIFRTSRNTQASSSFSRVRGYAPSVPSRRERRFGGAVSETNPLHAVRDVGEGVDKDRIERAVREILVAIGEDPDRDGLRRTPARVADMYAEICAGLYDHPSRHLTVTFEASHDEMVMVRDIPLYSLCEHHLAPFHGHAHV